MWTWFSNKLTNTSFHGELCTGYKENSDGVATEEVGDGGGIEEDGCHSKAPILEENDVCG